MNKYKKIIGLLLFLILAVLQLIPTDPPAYKDPTDADFLHTEKLDTELAILVKQACYDCHSDQVKYPWYSSIAPVSWWIYDHIEHGKKHLNFSAWADYEQGKKEHKIEECIEMLEEDEMPLWSYQLAHSEARLDESQKEKLLNWLKSY